METQPAQNQSQPATEPAAVEIKTDRQLLEEIHDFSRKTKNYMMWQLIITVALVVIPLIGALALIPFTLKTLGSVYSIDPSSINQFIQ